MEALNEDLESLRKKINYVHKIIVNKAVAKESRITFLSNTILIYNW